MTLTVPTLRERRVALAGFAVAIALLVAACGREPTSGGAPGRASLHFGRLFQMSGTTVIRDSVSQVRFIITRVSPAPVQVLTNVVQAVPNNNNGTDSTHGNGPDSLMVTFPLQGSDALYELVIKAFNPGSDTLFQIGPIRFGASQIDGTGAVRLVVPDSTIMYIGPGSDAVKVVASPRAVNLGPGQVAQFSAQAFGLNNAVIPRAVFSWSVVSGTDIAGVDNSGQVFAFNKRGTARIVVRIPSALNPSDTVSVNVALGPAQIQLVSGGNQSAPVNTQLPNPIVVKVVALDGVPVPGVLVTFNSAFASPGAATTDANGLAQTRWTLGSNVGTQTLGISAANLAQLQVQATATATVVTGVSLFNGTYTGFVTGGSGGGIGFVFTATNGSITVAIAGGDVLSGTVSTSGAITASSTSGTCSTVTFAGQITITSSGGATATGTWSQPAAAGDPSCAGSGTWTATRTASTVISFVSTLPTAITTSGSSTITVQVTGTNGQATTVFNSTVPETKTITATFSGSTAQTTLPVVTASSGATQLVKVSGDNQTVHYGTTFPQAITAQALVRRAWRFPSL